MRKEDLGAGFDIVKTQTDLKILRSLFKLCRCKECTVAYYGGSSGSPTPPPPPDEKSDTAGCALCCSLNDLDFAAICDVFTGRTNH